jgi:hypothetical protein
VQHIGNLLVLWRQNPKDPAIHDPAAEKRRKAQPMTKKQAATLNETRNRKR